MSTPPKNSDNNTMDLIQSITDDHLNKESEESEEGNSSSTSKINNNDEEDSSEVELLLASEEDQDVDLRLSKNESQAKTELSKIDNQPNVKTYATVAATLPQNIGTDEKSTPLLPTTPSAPLSDPSASLSDPSAPFVKPSSEPSVKPSSDSSLPINSSSESPDNSDSKKKVNIIPRIDVEEFIPLKRTSMLTKKGKDEEEEEKVEKIVKTANLLNDSNLEEISAEKIANQRKWKFGLAICGGILAAFSLTVLTYTVLKRRI